MVVSHFCRFVCDTILTVTLCLVWPLLKNRKLRERNKKKWKYIIPPPPQKKRRETEGVGEREGGAEKKRKKHANGLMANNAQRKWTAIQVSRSYILLHARLNWT